MGWTREELAKRNQAQIGLIHQRVANRVAKWRQVFAGWQLGTRLIGDPECDAVRDHREVTIMLRAEVTALTGLLIEKGIFNAREFTEALILELEMLDADYARRFPGFTSTDDGMRIETAKATETMKGWLP